MEINPTEVGRQVFYKIITGTIVPRPIAWVSTVNSEGQANLAPFSFFTAVASNPPTILFCPMTRSTDGGSKDTLNNIRATGEFVVNIVTERLLEAMNITATELPPQVNEFELAGLTPGKSKSVRPPRLSESPVNFECKVSQIVEIGAGAGSGNIVIGEVLHLHIADEVLLPNYRIDTQALNPVGRLAGPNYARVHDIISVDRPPSQITRKNN
ncbi:MAG: flavin reductase family protein [Anaerolineae bacterium]|nr:flavin reductase family protein [Anaerolineae bacterium]